MQVVTASTGLRREPNDDAALETELPFGEIFDIESEREGWVYGTVRVDGYRGYARLDDLSSHLLTPTHRIKEAHVPTYKEASFKKGRLMTLHMNSLVTVPEGSAHRVETPEGVLLQAERGGWIFEDQLRPIHEFAPDFVAEALKFVGTPYEWGGKGAAVDCSALLQTACLAAGIMVPRDCLPQSEAVGTPIVDLTSDPTLRRGDLVFWTRDKGRHVVIMIDGTHCVHATIAKPHRGVVVQPLSDVIADQRRDGNGEPTIRRRVLA